MSQFWLYCCTVYDTVHLVGCNKLIYWFEMHGVNNLKNLLLSSVPFFGLFTKTAAGTGIKIYEKISTDIQVSS